MPCLHIALQVQMCTCLYSSVAERQSCKLKVLGSIPSGGSARKTQALWHFGAPCGQTPTPRRRGPLQPKQLTPNFGDLCGGKPQPFDAAARRGLRPKP